MRFQVLLVVADAVLINVAFLCSFLIRYGLPIPKRNFLPYEEACVLLVLIHVSALACFGVYRDRFKSSWDLYRFKSSWDLFKRVFSGLSLGTLLGIAFVFVFRASLGAFPTSVFALSFLISLLLVFKANQWIFKSAGRIKKKVVILGRDGEQDVNIKKAEVERLQISQVRDLLKYPDIDEIVICQRLQNSKDMALLLYYIQEFRMSVVFTPSRYMELLPQKINGDNHIEFLNTFVGRKRDIDEFLIRTLDITGSIIMLLLCSPLMAVISLLVKITSEGPVFYKQQRVGKDGGFFTLYKFRTMVKDAEERLGPVLAKRDDPRVTKTGRFLRMTRLDELPQLFNVLKGDMSLVGPRPERPHFVKLHKALRELRLTVRPGLTGLAQIRNFYDLKPRHKIKYDYLYIQQRSLLLNLYILAKTLPVIISKKGW